MSGRCFSPICLVERILDRRPADAAEVPRPRLPVLAEGLRAEGEDAALEGMHRQRQRELRHGAQLRLRAETLQRTGARKGWPIKEKREERKNMRTKA